MYSDPLSFLSMARTHGSRPRGLTQARAGVSVVSVLLCLAMCAGSFGCGGTDSPTSGAPDGSHQGDDRILRSGDFEPQDGALSEGRACVVEERSGAHFLTFSENFRTELAAGTVHVYLAKTDRNLAEQRAADPGSISPLIGRVDEDGAHRFPLESVVADADYPYVILWCEPEAINFAACLLTVVP